MDVCELITLLHAFAHPYNLFMGLEIKVAEF